MKNSKRQQTSIKICIIRLNNLYLLQKVIYLTIGALIEKLKQMSIKRFFYILLLATLFVACNNVNHNEKDEISPDLTQIRIKERPCETLVYIGIIGRNYDTALDSLRKRKDIFSEIIKEPLDVIFDYDDRSFFGISYDECGNYSDVLDTKGNYYMRSWDCQEDNTDK